jgi:hypothetical protein
MIDFIKKYLKDLIFIALFVVVILQTCGKYKPQEPTIIRDTIINTIIHDSTIVEKPTKTTSVVPQTVIEKYYYDTNKSDLRDKYIELAKKFEEISTYNKTYPIDTIGSITILDTVAQNEIKGRSIKYDIKENQILIKETITLPYNPKRQVYAGGELLLSPTGVNGAAIGAFYKDRRDNVYKGSIGSNFALQPQISFGYYKPIKF